MAIPKNIGRDCELSTTGVDGAGASIAPFDVTKEILRRVGAVFEHRGGATWIRESDWKSGAGSWATSYSSDCLRHWPTNGQCYYSDMGHVEVCTAETLDPLQYGAQCIATLRVAEAARRRAQQEAEDGTRYVLTAANVDMLDPAISWGTHVNVWVTGELWESLFVDRARPGVFGFVSSAMAAMIPFFGAGYVMPMRDGSSIYSLSGRAHHITRVETQDTTRSFRRGLLNSRREPHGRGGERLHLIGFDFSILSAPLQCSLLQCCLAAAEEGVSDLNLHAPVDALHDWSWGMELGSGALPVTALLTDGSSLTLPQYVRALAERCLEMCEGGLIGETIAPRARDLLPRIVELTHYAEEGSIRRCAPSLDWAAKLMVLLDLCQATGQQLGDSAIRVADHDFVSTDPDQGVLWRLWREGMVDPMVEEAQVEACLDDGPLGNRGRARGRLIRRFREQITEVDWSHIELRLSDDRWGPRLRVNMPTPSSLSSERLVALVERARSPDQLAILLRGESEDLAEDTNPMCDIRSQLAIAPESP